MSSQIPFWKAVWFLSKFSGPLLALDVWLLKTAIHQLLLVSIGGSWQKLWCRSSHLRLDTHRFGDELLCCDSVFSFFTKNSGILTISCFNVTFVFAKICWASWAAACWAAGLTTTFCWTGGTTALLPVPDPPATGLGASIFLRFVEGSNVLNPQI